MEEGLLHNTHKDEEERNLKELKIMRWVVMGEVKEEGKRVLVMAAPMTVVTTSQYLIQVISSMMVGHLGQLSLASAALATSLSTVTGFSLLLGMASGLETLCGQAYGAQKYKQVGIYTCSALLSLLLVCIPISFIWLNMGKLLALIGQDPLISLEAGKYAVWMIPGLFSYAITQCMIKFLQSQTLVLPMVLSSALTLCLHIPLCWILVFKSGLGKVGAALSISISYWFNVLVLGLYIRYSKACKATRAAISAEALRCIGEFLRIGIPSAIMICLEWWSFELLVLLSGLLPNPKLETSILSICLNSISCLYNIPYGLSNAASTRVSNELGAGNPERARSVVRVVMTIAVITAIIVSVALFALRRCLGYAYSNEKEVVDYVVDMVPVLCIQVFMDNLQGTLSGVARGCGWQHIGAFVNLAAYYLIGIPLAIVLGFSLHMRGRGLRIGMLGGATAQTIFLLVVTISTNWQKQANLARERICHGSLSSVDEPKVRN